MLLWRYFPSVSSRQGSSNWVGRENHRVQPNILASVGIPASLQCHQIREPTVWQGSLILAQQFSCLLPMVPIPVVWSTADYVHLFFCPLFFFWLHCVAGRILVLQQGVIPMPLQWNREVLTTGPPGKSLSVHSLQIYTHHLRPARHCTQWWKYTKEKRDKVPALRDFRVWKNDPKSVQPLGTFLRSFKRLKTILMFIPNFRFLSIF